MKASSSPRRPRHVFGDALAAGLTCAVHDRGAARIHGAGAQL